MKRITTCLYLIIFITAVSCHHKVPAGRTINDVETAFRIGQLTLATLWADSMLKDGKSDSLAAIKLSSLIDQAGRIKTDFTLPESEINARLTKGIGEYSKNDRELWKKITGWNTG